jgi:SAM-dependent methyltransferase
MPAYGKGAQIAWRSLVLPDAFRAEFTGERVIPGRVEENLFNEHLARYRFTARLAGTLKGRFLDAGCGAGYGAAELAGSQSWVLGIDVSDEAIAHARANYSAIPNLRFTRASCTAIPARDAAFHLITAFEVIEHLAEWRQFLSEARRVLAPGGLFLVSTPNQLYYAESRKKAGPNPFHVHEFTESEFRYELQSIFPHVTMLLQNHVEGIAFSGGELQGAALEISQRADDPSCAHFFLAVCSSEPLPPITRFVFIPDSGNVLQTRERHIALLEGEIRQKNQWIETEKIARGRMEDKVRTLEVELEEHNRWARKANEEADRRAQLVANLQAELRKSNEWALARDAAVATAESRAQELEKELQASNAWALALDADARERGQRIVVLQEELAQATAWARSRDADAEERGARIIQLQEEQANLANAFAVLEQQMAESRAGYEAAIAQWRREKQAADQWAMDTERRLSVERDEAREAFAGKQAEFEQAQQQIASLDHQIEELQAQVADARRRMDMIAQSRWVRLGRTIRMGPEIARN